MIALPNENIDKHTLQLDTFLRSLNINKSQSVSLLLGAGASISSGMPSASRCILEWKRSIFVSNNPSLRDSVSELSLSGTQKIIQNWIDQHGGYPELNSPEEYSFYAQECLPITDDRRKFFQSFVQKAEPHTGYRLIPLLVKSGFIRTIWTTNFDSLSARACSTAGLTCIEIGMDSAQRTTRQISPGEIRIISLHGDYRYDSLKNTSVELASQESQLEAELISEALKYDLLVIGYSGRDLSLMSALNKAYSSNGNSRLYWCGKGFDASDATIELLGNAKKNGHDSYYVSTNGFDDLLSRIALNQLDGESLLTAKAIITTIATSEEKSIPFSITNAAYTNLIKSNAYPFLFPRQLLKLNIHIPPDTRPQEWLDEQLPFNHGAIVITNGAVFALSDSDHLSNAFGQAISSTPLPITLSDNDVITNSRFRSLLRKGIIRAISVMLEIDTDGTRMLWDKKYYQSTTYESVVYRLYHALSISITLLFNRPFLVMMPDIIVKQLDGCLAGKDIQKALRNAAYGYQHNAEFNTDLTRWVKKIVDVNIPSIGCGAFNISHVPVYSGLHKNSSRVLPESIIKFASQKGRILEDPNLVFCSLDGKTEVRSKNPLKGLVANRPWDYHFTKYGFSTTVDLAFICPGTDKQKLNDFIINLQVRSSPQESERDYLYDYPGFSVAFGLPLVFPHPEECLWQSIDDNIEGSVPAIAKSLAGRICQSIDIIRKIQPSAIVVIFVPLRWSPYKIVSTETERFNFHDYIKAYAARHGQGTQFIREETIFSAQQCRVRWWLALALYAKALRSPWRIDSLDNDTAFAGIGYSIETNASYDCNILLGCSHIYSGRGEGLQFRLGRIENPIIRRHKPFMSEDDARRMGETIRQLFFESKMSLPKRVVIHKRTPFIEEERRGLANGLEGVADIELVEINIEESLRYLASQYYNGELSIDRYPVERGTMVILDDSTMLLWVHGSAPSSKNPSFHYYQGKRRIPAPLRIKRYQGSSDACQIASEILGLSKMNWNNFDYYSHMPATLESASTIARIGTYLFGFGSASYDYRLLI